MIESTSDRLCYVLISCWRPKKNRNFKMFKILVTALKPCLTNALFDRKWLASLMYGLLGLGHWAYIEATVGNYVSLMSYLMLDQLLLSTLRQQYFQFNTNVGPTKCTNYPIFKVSYRFLLLPNDYMMYKVSQFCFALYQNLPEFQMVTVAWTDPTRNQWNDYKTEDMLELNGLDEKYNYKLVRFLSF